MRFIAFLVDLPISLGIRYIDRTVRNHYEPSNSCNQKSFFYYYYSFVTRKYTKYVGFKGY